MDAPLDLTINSQRYNVLNNNQLCSSDYLQPLIPHQSYATNNNNNLMQSLNVTYYTLPRSSAHATSTNIIRNCDCIMPSLPPRPPPPSVLELGHTETDSLSRPFKAISKNPTVLINDFEMRQKYQKFRQSLCLDDSTVGKRNDNMKRINKSQSPAINQSEEYMKQRQKNNEAAKRSRDNRKWKEDEMALQLLFFKAEISDLTGEIRHLGAENARLRQLLKIRNQEDP